MTEFHITSGICRCCHTQGTFKSLSDSYLYEGREELYLNMLQQAFNIDIKPTQEVSAAFSICDVCSPRLIDAFLFHQQVLSCEQSFYQYYNTHFKGSFCDKEIKNEATEQVTGEN
ncbi:uncharacterized protein LOC124541933 [Vanessa cardui]|uniref:uncharacterized protein LOC124541933 n=1 Tax=Vanessa cardui TaxID=171605 RepID=UPI001F143634|nr:uncharacterized protein LOC124541933 [Vanessa cardui]